MLLESDLIDTQNATNPPPATDDHFEPSVEVDVSGDDLLVDLDFSSANGDSFGLLFDFDLPDGGLDSITFDLRDGAFASSSTFDFENIGFDQTFAVDLGGGVTGGVTFSLGSPNSVTMTLDLTF